MLSGFVVQSSNGINNAGASAIFKLFPVRRALLEKSERNNDLRLFATLQQEDSLFARRCSRRRQPAFTVVVVVKKFVVRQHFQD
jgi:hypothetical protein